MLANLAEIVIGTSGRPLRPLANQSFAGIKC